MNILLLCDTSSKAIFTTNSETSLRKKFMILQANLILKSFQNTRSWLLSIYPFPRNRFLLRTLLSRFLILKWVKYRGCKSRFSWQRNSIRYWMHIFPRIKSFTSVGPSLWWAISQGWLTRRKSNTPLRYLHYDIALKTSTISLYNHCCQVCH